MKKENDNQRWASRCQTSIAQRVVVARGPLANAKLRLSTAMALILCAFFAGCRDTRLQQAIPKGDSIETAKLLDENVDVNIQGTGGKTPLHAAIEAHDRVTFLKLLEHRANPNKCDDSGKSAVHLAAEQEETFWLIEILRHGGDPDQPNTGNRFYPDSTPIFYAIWKKRSQNVQVLIEHGADINHPNKYGTTPALAACESNAESLLPLVKAGADPTHVDKPGRSLLNYWLTDSIVNLDPNDPLNEQFREAQKIVREKGFVIQKSD